MPFPYGDKIAVYPEELVPEWYSSVKYLSQVLSRCRDKCIGPKRITLGGCGRELLIDFDSLKPQIKEALGDPRKKEHPLVDFFKREKAAINFYQDFRRPNYGHLDHEEMDRYIINASMLMALNKLERARIDFRKRLGGSVRKTKNVKSVRQTIFEDAFLFQKILQRDYGTEHTLPGNPVRFHQKRKEFGQDNFTTLIRDPKGNSFKNNSKIDSLEIELLNNLFSGQAHKPTKTEVHDQYQAFLDGYIDVTNLSTGEQYNPGLFKPLSKSTVKHFLNKYENKLSNTQKRAGNHQEWISKNMPYTPQDLPQFAGSVLSIDDRQPPFKYPDGKSGKRMWYYIGLDVASRAITVWVSAETKEGLIKEFYRQLVRNYHLWNINLPYGLEAESSLNSQFTSTFLQNGAMFEDVRIEANNARGKYIERMFGKLRYQVEKKHTGWIARPTAKSENNQQDEDKTPIIPKTQIEENVLKDIYTWNNTEHEEFKGMTRWKFFIENQYDKLQPTNYKAILPHLGHQTKSSCNAGMINFRKTKYLLGNCEGICTGEELIDNLKKIEGKDIIIYWLDAHEDAKTDVVSALVYIGDKFICNIHPTPRAQRAKNESTEQHKANRALLASYQNTVASFAKEGKSKLDKVMVVDRRPEILQEDFKMPGMSFSKPKEDPNKGEIIEDFEDDFMFTQTVETSFKRSLKDRM